MSHYMIGMKAIRECLATFAAMSACNPGQNAALPLTE
jgi:hypothetical protein